MAPRRYSRHQFTFAYRDRFGDVVLSTPEPFRFVDRDDNRIVRVTGGETLFQITGRVFHDIFVRPAGFWWIVADFQPEPIFDPTLRLDDGRLLYIPSQRTIVEDIFNGS